MIGRTLAVLVLCALPTSVASGGQRPMIEIEVAADRENPAHTIAISAITTGAATSRDAVERRKWRAIRQGEVGDLEITSDQCPALREVALSFGDLPPLELTPFELLVFPHVEAPLGPSRKDGYSTRLRFTTMTVDGRSVQVDLRDGSAISYWGDDAVTRLAECWPVLPPDHPPD